MSERVGAGYIFNYSLLLFLFSLEGKVGGNIIGLAPKGYTWHLYTRFILVLNFNSIL